ncbi:MAG: rRNA maturation RNase YbeY [Bdellovibrionota bacterium]
MKINYLNQTQKKIPRKKLQTTVDTTHSFLRKQKLVGKDGDFRLLQRDEITLVFATPAQSKKLNLMYRNKKKPTDVLSFSPSDEDSIGELLLCPTVIEAQAPRFKHTYNEELIYMVIHGMIHLYGWDHERSLKEEKEMFALQDRIFAVVKASS